MDDYTWKSGLERVTLSLALSSSYRETRTAVVAFGQVHVARVAIVTLVVVIVLPVIGPGANPPAIHDFRMRYLMGISSVHCFS